MDKYAKTKIYFDGSHYIGIPKTEQKWKKPKVNKEDKKRKVINEKIKEMYRNVDANSKKDKIEIIASELSKKIGSKERATEIVKANVEKINRNLIVRKSRFVRKVYSHKWNYFCTFTYDSTKVTEEEFKKKLCNCLSHLASRKQWRYVGVWERSPENKRLHFHGLFCILEMVGELIETKDYSTKNHEMQTTIQNTYFLDKFGRNDFKQINQKDLGQSIAYMLKYIQKSGEKIVYSKHIETYFVSDILESDVVCTIGNEDRKILLFDDFHCLIDGELIGKVSQDVIEQMPRVN